MIKAKNSIKGKTNASIIHEKPELENLTVTPTTEEQHFKSENYYGYDNVIVNPIQGEDLNITPSTEEQVSTGVYTKVTVNPIQGETLNIIPNEEQQHKNGIFLEVNVDSIQTEQLEPTINFETTNQIEIQLKQ